MFSRASFVELTLEVLAGKVGRQLTVFSAKPRCGHGSQESDPR